MAELAEGARLLSEYSGDPAIEGSNPSLSATVKGLRVKDNQPLKPLLYFFDYFLPSFGKKYGEVPERLNGAVLPRSGSYGKNC